jgi:hypothetical protein
VPAALPSSSCVRAEAAAGIRRQSLAGRATGAAGIRRQPPAGAERQAKPAQALAAAGPSDRRSRHEGGSGKPGPSDSRERVTAKKNGHRSRPPARLRWHQARPSPAFRLLRSPFAPLRVSFSVEGRPVPPLAPTFARKALLRSTFSAKVTQSHPDRGLIGRDTSRTYTGRRARPAWAQFVVRPALRSKALPFGPTPRLLGPTPRLLGQRPAFWSKALPSGAKHAPLDQRCHAFAARNVDWAEKAREAVTCPVVQHQRVGRSCER